MFLHNSWSGFIFADSLVLSSIWSAELDVYEGLLYQAHLNCRVYVYLTGCLQEELESVAADGEGWADLLNILPP